MYTSNFGHQCQDANQIIPVPGYSFCMKILILILHYGASFFCSVYYFVSIRSSCGTLTVCEPYIDVFVFLLPLQLFGKTPRMMACLYIDFDNLNQYAKLLKTSEHIYFNMIRATLQAS